MHRIAILSRGDRETDQQAAAGLSRFTDLVAALREAGSHVEAAIYDEQFSDEVRDQLLAVDLVLVWVNPIDAGRDRSDLDRLLGEVAAAGVTVSCHPDVVLKLGTKRVLFDTRHLGWGTDTALYRSGSELIDGLCASLQRGPRVLKQHRGSSGDGVWSVEVTDPSSAAPTQASMLRVRHAKRGSEDELLSLAELAERCGPYFAGGLMIDQAFQPRIAEGMVRCYLVRDQVAGFGLQATNALIPAAGGEPAPAPGQRLYHPPTLVDHQRLKAQLENEWVPAIREQFGLAHDQLPLLWDCDFLLGSPDSDGLDTYVLCEINVSSVSPYPESVVAYMVRAISATVPGNRDGSTN